MAVRRSFVTGTWRRCSTVCTWPVCSGVAIPPFSFGTTSQTTTPAIAATARPAPQNSRLRVRAVTSTLSMMDHVGVRLGVVFPQVEVGADPGGVRAFAQAAEELGYDHLLAYVHVLGADTTDRPDWPGPYRAEDQFHEIFVLFGYLAAVAPGLELVAGVLVLPQRQTALAAKQAAEIDLLTGGRFRLGVGLGWNYVEFEALGEDFTNRGRRSEEQIEVMRRLWTEPVVDFEGTWHRIPRAGINPLPVQRPIPVWIGASAEPALRR